MARPTTRKVLQCKIALSNRALRTEQPIRLSLLEAIKAINTHFQEPSTRRAPYGEKAVECRAYREVDNIVGIYLVGYVPDDSVGIVPHAAAELALLPPPDDADFLDGELMALIAEDVVIVCRLGLFESALNAYVESLGPAAGLNREDASFSFRNRTDVDKLQIIADDGVALIRFNGVASAIAVDHIAEDQERSLSERLTARVWRELKAIAHVEHRPELVSESLKVEVSLKYDKRSGTQIDQQSISEMAETVALEHDGFFIKTLSGRQIRPNDVLINKNVELQRFGKSVAFDQVFAEMQTYYQELTALGRLEDDD